MKVLRELSYSWRQVTANWQDYFKTMLMFQLIHGLVGVPLLSYLFFKVLSKAGLTSITNTNLKELFHSPIAIIIGIVFLLVLILLIFYEVGFYLLMARTHAENKQVKLWDLFVKLNKKASYFLSIYSLLLVGYFLLLIPIASMGIDSELTSMIKIPDFIVDELRLTSRGLILFTGLLAGLTYISLRLLYLIYFLVSDDNNSIWESIKKSWVYSKGRSLHNFILLGLIGLGTTLAILSFTLVVFSPLALVEYQLPKAAPVFAGIALTVMQLVIFLVRGLFQPLTANSIVATTLDLSHQVNKVSQDLTFGYFVKHSKLWVKLLLTLVFCFVIFGNIVAAKNLVYDPQTQIIAHRGYMERGVENSLGGLAAAAEVGADSVELDIQETADHEFVVIHDANLKRLAKRNQEVYQLDLADLITLPIYQNNHEDRIPSLREFIRMALELDIDLLIEIKPHGHESPEMVANLVQLLREEKVNSRFIVQSLDLGMLDELKKLAPEIRTGYVIPLNIGKLPETVHDIYVLEEFSITNTLMQEASEKGKQIYVWTVNTDELLQKYLSKNVDGIITNRPDRGVDLRDNGEITNTFLNRVKFLLE